MKKLITHPVFSWEVFKKPHPQSVLLSPPWKELPSCGRYLFRMVCGDLGLIGNRYCKNLHHLFETPVLLAAEVAEKL